MATSENVDIKVNADSGAAQAALERIAASLDKIQESSGKASQAAQSSFDMSLGNVAKMAGAIAGIGSAMALVNKVGQMVMAEYENFLARNRAAGQTTISAAKAGEELGVVAETGTYENVKARIAQISKRTGVSYDALLRQATGVLSARGNLSQNVALNTLEEAAMAQPYSAAAGTIGPGVEAVFSIMKRFPQVSPKQALAGVFNVSAASRSRDLASTAENLIPAIAMIAEMVGDKNFGPAARFATGFGGAADDPHLRRTATAVISTTNQLLTLAKGKGYRGQGFEALEAFYRGTPEGKGILQGLLGPYQTGDIEGFKAKLGLVGEKRTILPAIQYLQYLQSGEENSTIKQIRQAGQLIPELTDPRNVGEFNQRLGALRGDPTQRLAGIDRMLESATEDNLRRDPMAAATGIWRSRLKGYLQSAGVSAAGQGIAETVFDVQTAMAGTPEDVQAAGISALRRARYRGGRPIGQGWAIMPGGMQGDGLTEQQRITNQKLDELINALSTGQKITIDSGGESARGVMQSQAQGAGR